MNRAIFSAPILFALLCAACSGAGADADPTEVARQTRTADRNDTRTAKATTPEATNTPKPTATPTEPPDRRVDGSVSLQLSETLTSARMATDFLKDSPCYGEGGYSDINAGMEVTLLLDGKIVDLARLGPGKVLSRTPGTVGANGYGTLRYSCTFFYELTVPEDGDFFVVKAGRRGEKTYTRAELFESFALAYSLGSYQ